jgi:Flp pilus assembly protein TadB
MKILVIVILTLSFITLSHAETSIKNKAPQTKIQQAARAKQIRLEEEEKEKEDVKNGIKKSIKKVPATLEEALKENDKNPSNVKK